ncbi:hypothetical protein ACFPIJ_61950 [Dactylosporangium cerinum]|uniref:Uncharacterized protein n=1 Tax=Dactylosporangium cerinum TaxID=1434730 RepID=A0ABV9WL65_9ACTN
MTDANSRVLPQSRGSGLWQRNVAIGLLPPCVVLATIDAWFSMQTMVGLLGPRALDLVAGVVLALVLTLAAVLGQLVKDDYRTWSFRIVLGLLLLVDFATSLAGAIWYGAMRQDFSSPIVLNDLRVTEDTLVSAVLFGTFTVLVTLGGVQLGRSINVLRPPLAAVSGDAPMPLDTDQSPPAAPDAPAPPSTGTGEGSAQPGPQAGGPGATETSGRQGDGAESSAEAVTIAELQRQLLNTAMQIAELTASVHAMTAATVAAADATRGAPAVLTPAPTAEEPTVAEAGPVAPASAAEEPEPDQHEPVHPEPVHPDAGPDRSEPAVLTPAPTAEEPTVAEAEPVAPASAAEEPEPDDQHEPVHPQPGPTRGAAHLANDA